jgi:hypothetical protein
MMPAGFVQEGTVVIDEAIPTSVPKGFIQEEQGIPVLKTAPDKTLYDKVIGFFKDPEKQIARSQNIYNLSEVTGLSVREVNRNYETLSRSSKVTGMIPDTSNKEYMQMLMLPGIALGAVTNPVGTAAGLIAFGALNKAIPTDKFVKHLEEEGISEEVINTIELADLIGKGMIIGGVFNKAPKVAEMFTRSKIVEYKMPETLTLTSEQVRDIWQTGKLTTQEQQSLFGSLELNSYDTRAAIEHGININIPAEKIVRLTDKPYWSKVKSWFGQETKIEVSTTQAGKPTKEVSGLIEGKTTGEGKVSGDPVKKIISALKEAKSVRGEQETLYAKERSKKFAKMQSVKTKGEKGFYAQLGALKGEMPKVEFEAIRGKISQEDIDSLFNMVKESPKIGPWEKLGASQGLAKMFGELGGKVPTKGEIALLHEVFGKEFTQAILDKQTTFEKMKEIGYQLANIPRSLMASFDLSAPMRQGVFFIGRPKQWLPAFKEMFGAFKGEKQYKVMQDSIINHPDYLLARESDLALTDMDVLLGNREEAFMSNWAEKIPLLGKGVRASGRAYVGFLNKLRFDVFTDLVNKAELMGLDARKNRDLTKAISDFINNATGRGTLPLGLQRAAITLNSVFFSPRLIMSRLNLVNPVYYMKQTPFVRKEALKSLFAFVGFGMTILTLSKLAGAEVGSDPRSSEFGKIKINNTRIDVWGGFQPLVRVAGQLISGKYVSSTTGKEMTLGEGYKPMTRADIVQRFFEGKLAPVPSFIVTLMKGQSIEGEKVNVPKEIALRFTPMVIQDMYDILQDSPGLFPVSLLGLFGVGSQTYKQKTRF